MKKKSIFKASFEESLNLEDDGFRKLQQEQHDKIAKFFKKGQASLWFRIRSFIVGLICPVGFNFILLAVSLGFRDNETSDSQARVINGRCFFDFSYALVTIRTDWEIY